MANLASRLDAILSSSTYGLLSARPAAGHEGAMYFATDQTGLAGGAGVLYYDNGTSWVTVNVNQTFNGRSGTIVPAAGDYTAAQVTNAADKSNTATQSFSGGVSAPFLGGLGLTGATAGMRMVGATVSGPPTSGAFNQGDVVVSQDGRLFVCSTGGSPGTWDVPVGGILAHAIGPGTNTDTVSGNSPLTIISATCNIVAGHQYLVHARGQGVVVTAQPPWVNIVLTDSATLLPYAGDGNCFIYSSNAPVVGGYAAGGAAFMVTAASTGSWTVTLKSNIGGSGAWRFYTDSAEIQIVRCS